MITPASLLLLADSRFPTGAHAHSGGIEAAVHFGWIKDVSDVERFLRGRISTNGLTDATFAAATTTDRFELSDLDVGLSARIASPRARATSRSLGRQLVRAGSKAWPSTPSVKLLDLHPDGPMQGVALGAVAHAAGLSPTDAALCSLHHLIGTATSAVIRLLGLDPYLIHALAADLANHLNEIARQATESANAARTIKDLPAHGSLTADLCAEHHATWEVRLFAS